MTHARTDFLRLSQLEIADMLGISARTVRRWTRNDEMPRRRDGTYAAPNVIAWLLSTDSRWRRDREYLTRELKGCD